MPKVKRPSMQERKERKENERKEHGWERVHGGDPRRKPRVRPKGK